MSASPECTISRSVSLRFQKAICDHKAKDDSLAQRALQDPSKSDSPGRLARLDDGLSIARLVAKQDNHSGSLDPRAYQIELFERAKARNTIAVLDTGMLLPKLWIERNRLTR